MSALVSLVGAALLLRSQHPAMPKGISHEEHLEQMQKEDELKRRGADAMGFDQDATTHHFRLTSTGGSIEVTVKNEKDGNALAAVRSHLRTIADDFGLGQFDKPLQTHGEVPAGVFVMETNSREISYVYEDLPHGGAVRIETTNSRARDAVHDFLRYQIKEHRTGDPLELNR